MCNWCPLSLFIQICAVQALEIFKTIFCRDHQMEMVLLTIYSFRCTGFPCVQVINLILQTTSDPVHTFFPMAKLQDKLITCPHICVYFKTSIWTTLPQFILVPRSQQSDFFSHATSQTNGSDTQTHTHTCTPTPTHTHIDILYLSSNNSISAFHVINIFFFLYFSCYLFSTVKVFLENQL